MVERRWMRWIKLGSAWRSTMQCVLIVDRRSFIWGHDGRQVLVLHCCNIRIRKSKHEGLSCSLNLDNEFKLHHLWYSVVMRNWVRRSWILYLSLSAIPIHSVFSFLGSQSFFSRFPLSSTSCNLVDNSAIPLWAYQQANMRTDKELWR